jgi:predicted PurR-regulated permease PerM
MRLFLLPLSILATLAILWLAKPVLVPVLLALLLAQLLSPIVGTLEKRIPEFLAVALAVGSLIVVVAGVVAIMAAQFSTLETNLPLMGKRISQVVDNAVGYLGGALGIFTRRPNGFLRDSLTSSLETGTGGAAAMSAVTFTVATLAEVTLVLILTYLMLFYRRHFRRHLKRLAERSGSLSASAVLDRTAEIGQSYVAGLGTVMLLVGVADTVGFMLVGAPFPALLGLLGSLSVMIPYVGIAVTAPAGAMLAWLETGSPSIAGGVLLVFFVVHALEGNVISPWLVGSKVDLNPFATLLAVLVGGQLWGPAGMILFIPLVGLVKLMLEATEGGTPVARLLGRISSEDRAPRRPRRRGRAVAIEAS